MQTSSPTVREGEPEGLNPSPEAGEDPDALPPEVPISLSDDRWMSDSECYPMPDPEDERHLERDFLETATDARDLSEYVLDEWHSGTGMSLESYLRNVFAGTSSYLGEVSLASELEELSLNSVRLRADVCQGPQRRRVGVWEQIFNFSPFGTEVEHLRLYIEDAAASQGLGQELWSSAIATYKEMGISRVGFWADEGARGFGLAQYGVKPSTSRATEELFSSLRKKISGLRLSRDLVTRVHQILNRSEPEALWDLVDLKDTWLTPEGVEIPVGQALLAGELWPGILDLKDDRAMARANRFLDPVLTERGKQTRPAVEEILDSGRTRVPLESVSALVETGLTLDQACQLLNCVA